jgi:hypothetical protein
VSGVAKDLRYIQGVADDKEAVTRGWSYGTYLDLGYPFNFNDPGNGLWRSKSTTFKGNDPQVNMAMGYIRKSATPQSRWGMEFGLQAGVDTENLVPVTPPDFNEPISHADFLSHLYRANGTYLFPAGKGLEVTAGVQGTYPLSDTFDLSLFALGGWNYLAHPNDAPSYGLQAVWQLSPRITFTQNLYYGPDQDNTAIQFWRFFSDSIIEWKNDRFLLAAAFDVGTEKQTGLAGNPRYNWMAGAVWAGWHISGPWSMAVRPEIYWDPDGISTGADQLIQAVTTTLQYTFSPFASNTFVAALEYRYDRSTGPEGGFFKGDDNRLVPQQHQVIFSFMWTFGS